LTQNLDFLGDDQRVQMIADILQQSQQQLHQLKQAMLANDHSEDEQIPDWPTEPKPSYGKQMGRLTTGVQRVLDANRDIADEIAEEAFRRRRQAKRERVLLNAKQDEAFDRQEHEREMAEKARAEAEPEAVATEATP
jgi:hypothetical protein